MDTQETKESAQPVVEITGNPESAASATNTEPPSSRSSQAGVETPATAVEDEEEEWVYPFPTDFKLTEQPIDVARPLKVAVIGAGIAGITAGILLPAKVPEIQLTIFEKNSDVGGTWHENIYPGIRCDVPAHIYQCTFSPNTQWSEVFAQGHEIREYWRSVARKFDVYRYIRFSTKVIDSVWLPDEAKWRVRTMNVPEGKRERVVDGLGEAREVVEEKYDFVITAIGHFNEWRLPDFPGINEYEGHLRHSSNWDPSFDPHGKRIALIGNGSSGIQLMPELQRMASHVDHYARSRTWIATPLNGPNREAGSPQYSAEQRKEFEDPKKYLAFRKDLEDKIWRRFEAQVRDSDVTKKATAHFKEMMRNRLAERPDIFEQIVPDFPPHCRRLTPGPGYLEALTKENVEFIPLSIEQVTKKGIIASDGKERKVDAIICATGANVDFAPPFPIVSGDIDLSKAWKPDGEFGFPYNYLGLATPGFKNLIFLYGPNASGTAGTVPHSIETQLCYISKLLRKVSTQGILSMSPSKAATDDFITYCDAYFPRTNIASKCSSWANGRRAEGRIHGFWPGSAAHVTHVRKEPRWEDWEYEYVRPENRFSYWGFGRTAKEMEEGSDMTIYLKERPDEIDLRDIHESWWEV